MQFQRSRKPSPALDISPLIDVVLQLLVFFMLSSTFLVPKIGVALPKAGPGESVERRQTVVVTAAADGTVYVDGRAVAEADLVTALTAALQASERRVVTFRGDGRVPYARVVRLIDAARTAGAQSFDMAHLPAEPSRERP